MVFHRFDCIIFKPTRECDVKKERTYEYTRANLSPRQKKKKNLAANLYCRKFEKSANCGLKISEKNKDNFSILAPIDISEIKICFLQIQFFFFFTEKIFWCKEIFNRMLIKWLLIQDFLHRDFEEVEYLLPLIKPYWLEVTAGTMLL